MTADSHVTDRRRTVDGRLVESRSADSADAQQRRLDGRSAEERPMDARLSDGRAGEGFSAEGGAGEGRAAESRPTEGRPTESRPTEGRPTEGRPTEGRPAEGRPVKLRILDRDVQLACRPGEEDDLMQAAAYVDKSMRDLRQRNAASGIEKIAIVTAINTANALLKARSQQGEDNSLASRLASINEKLDHLLSDDHSTKS